MAYLTRMFEWVHITARSSLAYTVCGIQAYDTCGIHVHSHVFNQFQQRLHSSSTSAFILNFDVVGQVLIPGFPDAATADRRIALTPAKR